MGKGIVNDTTDMRNYYLSGGAFAEPMKVSVSPDGERWYTYEEGPYCDTGSRPAVFTGMPGSSAHRQRLTKKKMGFTKPVNPALSSVLGVEEKYSRRRAISPMPAAAAEPVSIYGVGL